MKATLNRRNCLKLAAAGSIFALQGRVPQARAADAPQSVAGAAGAAGRAAAVSGTRTLGRGDRPGRGLKSGAACVKFCRRHGRPAAFGNGRPEQLSSGVSMAEITSMRVDKWLWAARFFKTRSLAQEAVELGRVRIGGIRIKPSREVKPGDLLEITRAEEHFEVYVEALSGVRGPAPVAQKLYRETDESQVLRQRAADLRKYASEPAQTIAKGRPTKRDMRKLRSFKDGW